MSFKINIKMEFSERKRKYGLSFLVPSSPGYITICRLESETPFPPIHKGDIIDPRTWEGESFDKYMEMFNYGDLLKADIIYHQIVSKNGSYGNHDIDIFTKVVKK